jgi:predicted metal-dependent peptidase
MNSVELKLVQARTNLLMDHEFFGALATRLDLVASERFPTMATDGRSIYYNPAFVEKMTVHETCGVICHEVLHVTQGHCWRRGGREYKAWQRATDLAINPIILNAGLVLPTGGLVNPKYDGWAAEQIYPLEQQEQEKGGGGQGQDSGNEPDSGCGEVLDNTGPESEVERAEWETAVMQAAQAAKAQGKLPAGMERLVEQLGKARVDWKSVMRRFIQQSCKADYTWKKPAVRYLASGLYLPSLYSEAMPPVVDGIDTSGSVENAELAVFEAEQNAIMREVLPEKLYAVYCDAKVQKVDEFERGEVITFKPKGGGGTDFRPVFSWVEKEGIDPACLVYLTDGMGTYPEQPPPYPVLWVMTTDVQAPFGEIIKIQMEQ